MAKDVKHRIPAFRTKKRKPRWKPFALAGLILAGSGGLITVISKWTAAPNIPELAVVHSERPEETHFGYFRLLEDREKRVPESKISDEQRNLRLGNQPTPGEFSLLVGTFKTRDKADSIRQQILAFESLKPRMEEVTLEFASWYRLKLGPYANLRDANQVRLFLRDHGIDSIIETEDRR